MSKCITLAAVYLLTLAVVAPVQARGGGGRGGSGQAGQGVGANLGAAKGLRAKKDADDINGDIKDKLEARDKLGEQGNASALNKATTTARTNQRPAALANQKTVQQIRNENANFHAKPNESIPSVEFRKLQPIPGSQTWAGLYYDVFRTYRPESHDRAWWHAHFPNVALVCGGWYYWNSGYWCPAWGYDPSAAYYPYDGPIYGGLSPTPVDQVIANVQSVLQQLGYYFGEIDGLLGPSTRAALAKYQAAQGLTATSAIDQPTLKSLGLV